MPIFYMNVKAAPSLAMSSPNYKVFVLGCGFWLVQVKKN